MTVNKGDIARPEIGFVICSKHYGNYLQGTYNITKGKDVFCSYYKNWTRRIIKSVYHHELSMFGYAFDHIVDDKLIVPLSDSFQRKIEVTRNNDR